MMLQKLELGIGPVKVDSYTSGGPRESSLDYSKLPFSEIQLYFWTCCKVK